MKQLIVVRFKVYLYCFYILLDMRCFKKVHHFSIIAVSIEVQGTNVILPYNVIM